MGMGSIQLWCKGLSVDVKQDRPGNRSFPQHSSEWAGGQSQLRVPYIKKCAMQLPNTSTHHPKSFSRPSPLPVRYAVHISAEGFLDPRKVSSNFVIIVAEGR